MASIRKRELSSGKSVWVVDFKDETSKRRNKNFERKRDAEAFLDDVKRQLRDGSFMHDEATVSVAESASAYLESAPVRSLDIGTQRQYEQHVRLYIQPLLGHLLLTQLYERSVYEFLDEIHAEQSAAMARRVLGTLNRVIKFAQRRNHVRRNVIADKSIKSPRPEPFIKRMPEHSELAGLCETSEGKGRVLLMTAMLTGMRLGELRGLNWANVLFSENVIRAHKACRADGSFKQTKSDNGLRQIPIGRKLAVELKKWQLKCPPGSKNLVFPNGAGNVESGSNIRQRIFIPAMKAIGLTTEGIGNSGNKIDKPVFRFHDLRHAAAALFIEQGMGPKRIQELMGHSSIQVTFDIYGYLFRDPEADAAAVDAISAKLLGA